MDFTDPRLHQLSSVWQRLFRDRETWVLEQTSAHRKKEKKRKIVLLASVSPQGSKQIPVKSI